MMLFTPDEYCPVLMMFEIMFSFGHVGRFRLPTSLAQMALPPLTGVGGG